MKTITLLMIVSLLLACSLCVSQQDAAVRPKQRPVDSLQEKSTQTEQIASIVSEIEKALQNNSVETITRYFTKKISLNLRGTESGIYSTNQAHYIVQEFFGKHKLTNFRFTTKGTSEELFATGGGTLFIRGKRETVQVYVGLVRAGSSYLISQFNIY